MKIFVNKSGKLVSHKEKPFKHEREIQKLFESNLQDIMGLDVVKSEFTIKNKRIDTLAFDSKTRAFTIIENKRDKNISVVDQGFTYLSLMLENKADFIIEYNENNTKPLKREDVDWSQTRVAFVSQSFTDNQVLATNFKDIAIELWEVKQYDDNLITIHNIKKTQSAESIKPISQQNQAFKKVAEEIKVYSEEDNLATASEEIVELYERFKSAILNLADGIEVKPQKFYIAFKKDKNIVDLQIQKNSIKIFINKKKGTLDDPKKLMRDVSEIGHWGNGDYQVQVSNDENLEYIMSLFKQALL